MTRMTSLRRFRRFFTTDGKSDFPLNREALSSIILTTDENQHTINISYKKQVLEMEEVTNLNIKIDRDLKAQADKLFNDMGMNLTTAVNVFVRQAVLEKAVPFRIYRSAAPSAITENSAQQQAAMQETRDLLASIG
jgi:DNA-damage-inducible protein J